MPRELALHFAIDANRINARQGLPNMNRLESWKADGLISIEMPQTAHTEAREGGDVRRRWKASALIFTINTHQNPEELEVRERIAAILTTASKPDIRTANDIDIVANAHKYGCILITADGASRSQPGGILGHKDALATLGVRVVTDAEAVAIVQDKIRRRDAAEINLAQVQGRTPAWWVGRDL